jgi:hypothetical protein
MGLGNLTAQIFYPQLGKSFHGWPVGIRGSCKPASAMNEPQVQIAGDQESRAGRRYGMYPIKCGTEVTQVEGHILCFEGSASHGYRGWGQICHVVDE